MFQRKGEFNFVLIGAKSTGKTWYIKYLAKREGVTALDDNTINYIELISEQDKATSISYTELFFNYKDKFYNIEFQIDDYDGNFVETWHEQENNSAYKEKLTEYVKESEGIFIFLPYESSDDTVRFDSMQRETDVFISKIKEEYGEEHSELPIPIVIVVSKWDNSPYYKAENEFEKAKEYIESNPILSLIKSKIEVHFKHIDIIPVSSAKNYNIELPIKLCLDKTFQNWEGKIEKLKNNKQELLIFLKSILYDIRFYKGGKYKELYDSLELEISTKYLSEINNLKNINEFNDYYDNAYKSIRETFNGTTKYNVLDALSDMHRKEIEEKRVSLENKKSNKNIGIMFSILAFIGLSVSGYFYYQNKEQEKREEQRLFEDIQLEYEKENLSTAIKDIKIYKDTYSDYTDKQHYSKIKNIEEEIKSKYSSYLDSELQKLQESKSIIDSYKTIEEIKETTQSSQVSSEQWDRLNSIFDEFKELKDTYDSLSTEVNELSKTNIDNLTEIKNKELKLQNYNELQEINIKLNKQINAIAKSALNSDSVELVQKMIDICNQEDCGNTLGDLESYLPKLKLIQEFHNLVRELEEIDELDELITKIKTNWKEGYPQEYKNKIFDILSKKYNEWLTNKLKDLPQSIYNSDDYARIEDFLKDNNYRLENLPPYIDKQRVISSDNKSNIDEKVKLYKEYKKIYTVGIYTTQFIVSVKDGNKLGLETGVVKDEDQLNVYINGYKAYSYETDSSLGLKNNKMVFSRSVYYKIRKYTIELEEVDIAGNDHVSGTFELTFNDLIMLKNNGELSKYLEVSGEEQAYMITIKR